MNYININWYVKIGENGYCQLLLYFIINICTPKLNLTVTIILLDLRPLYVITARHANTICIIIGGEKVYTLHPEEEYKQH